VVVNEEDAEIGGVGEAGTKELAAVAPDLAFIDVRLRAVDCHERDVDAGARAAMLRVTLAEVLLEAQVAHVPRVVEPGTTTTRSHST
jgi:hypothetical protein